MPVPLVQAGAAAARAVGSGVKAVSKGTRATASGARVVNTEARRATNQAARTSIRRAPQSRFARGRAEQALGRSRRPSIFPEIQKPRKQKEKHNKTTTLKQKVKTRIGVSFPWGFMSISASIAFLLYLYIQLPFALMSLASFYVQWTVSYIQEETLLGRFANMFVDLHSLVPVQDMGFEMLGTSMAVSFAIFIAFAGYLYFLKDFNPFGGTLLFVFTVSCLWFNISPVTNIFPWLFFWIIMMSILLYTRMLSRSAHTPESAT